MVYLSNMETRAKAEARGDAKSIERLPPINGYAETFSSGRGDIVRISAAGRPALLTQDSSARVHETVLVDCKILEAVSAKVVLDIPIAAESKLLEEIPATHDKGGAAYSFSISIPTANLPQGLYECRLVASDGKTSSGIYFNLRPDEASIKNLDALVILPTFTWQAYNDIGGGSFYTAHVGPNRKVSLKRPIAVEGLHSAKGAIPLLKTLRDEGYNVACIDSLDLHKRAVKLSLAPVVILVGHDEYWSARMRKQIDGYIRGGGSVVVFGGNTCWWRVSVRGGEISVLKGKRWGRTKKHRRGKAVGRRRFDQWFRPHIATPEEATFGSSYRFGGYSLERVVKSGPLRLKALIETSSAEDIDRARAMVVTRKDHPVFAGITLPADGRFGGEVPIVHGEIDAVRLDGNGHIDRTICPHVPKEARVLATGRVVSSQIQPTGTPEVGIVVESRIGRGLVLNFGSFGWWLGIYKNDPAVKRVLINAINYCRLPPSKRPLRARRGLPRRILEKMRRLLHI